MRNLDVICSKVRVNFTGRQGHFNLTVLGLACNLTKQHGALNDLDTYYFLFALYFPTYRQP